MSEAKPSTGVVKPERVTLSREEKALLAEALEQCRQAADEMQDRLVTLGVWLLRRLFADDARAVVDGAVLGRARVWRELRERAGGPTLRIGERMLSVALRIAAWDRLIVDDHWRGLDVGCKERLLPLGEAKRLRDGARHVTSFRLSQRATTAYVNEVLREVDGTEPAVRVTRGRVTALLRNVRQRFDGKGVRRRLSEIGSDAGARTEIAEEIDQTIAVLRQAKADLKAR